MSASSSAHNGNHLHFTEKKNIDQLIFFFACRLHFSAELRGCVTLDFPKKLQSQRQGEVGWVLAQSQIASANIFSSCWHLRTHVWSDICLRLTELICNSIIFDCVVDDLSQCSLHSATAERRQCRICRADPAPFSAPLPSQHPRWLPPPPHQIDWENSSAYFMNIHCLLEVGNRERLEEKKFLCCRISVVGFPN